MALVEERIMDYIDDLQLQIDRLKLENAQLKLQNEHKDEIIRQLARICDNWYAEIKKYDVLHESEKVEDEHCDICYTCEHMCDIQRKYIGAKMLSCVRYSKR